MGSGTKEHLLAILPFPEPKEAIERIRKQFPDIDVTYHNLLFKETPWKGASEIPEDVYKSATILVTLSALPKHPPQSCPNLRLIHFISAGTNHIATHPIYTSTSIPLTTSSGIHGPQIAEWVIMTMLNSSHNYNMLAEWQRNHRWDKGSDEIKLSQLKDKTGQRIGVLGYGSIGRQVARVSKALGMDVVAYTASPRETPESKKDHGFILPDTGDPDGSIPSAWFSGLDKASLHNFLQQDLDHLLISVPLTPETTKFIGAEEFAILGKKRHAFISNISRGQIIDQAALISALKTYDDNDPLKGGDGGGGLRGASLDVTDPEPLPKEDPLWDAPNCIMTPHISGMGSAYVERAFEVLEVNLERRQRGEQMINVVNRKRGY